MILITNDSELKMRFLEEKLISDSENIHKLRYIVNNELFK